MFVQVALGKPYCIETHKYMEAAEEGYDSTHGTGVNTPDPAFDACLPTGKCYQHFLPFFVHYLLSSSIYYMRLDYLGGGGGITVANM